MGGLLKASLLRAGRWERRRIALSTCLYLIAHFFHGSMIRTDKHYSMFPTFLANLGFSLKSQSPVNSLRPVANAALMIPSISRYCLLRVPGHYMTRQLFEHEGTPVRLETATLIMPIPTGAIWHCNFALVGYQYFIKHKPHLTYAMAKVWVVYAAFSRSRCAFSYAYCALRLIILISSPQCRREYLD